MEITDHLVLEFKWKISVQKLFSDKYQEFWVELSYPYETEYLSLTIEGVHAGTSWDDTPITDVRAFGI